MNVEKKRTAPPYKPPRVTRLLKLSMNRRVRLCEAQNWRCPDCGKRMDFDAIDPNDSPTMEHVIPISLGGPDDVSNVVMACGACNQAINVKMDLLPEYDGLKFAFNRAGVEDWTDGLMLLARDQADELIRLRSDLSSSTQRNGMQRRELRNRNIELDDLRREAKALERERDVLRIEAARLVRWPWRGTLRSALSRCASVAEGFVEIATGRRCQRRRTIGGQTPRDTH